MNGPTLSRAADSVSAGLSLRTADTVFGAMFRVIVVGWSAIEGRK